MDDLFVRRTKRGQRTAEARLAALPRPTPAVTESLQRTIEALEAELAAIDSAIRHLFSQQPVLTAQRDLLLTLPGVGTKVVPYLLVDLHRFQARTQGAGTAKGFTAFEGLDLGLQNQVLLARVLELVFGDPAHLKELLIAF